MADNSRHFGGTSADKIVKTTPTGIAVVTGGFTFGCWVYITNYHSGHVDVIRVGPAATSPISGRGFLLGVRSDGKPFIRTPDALVYSSGNVGTGAWHFISGSHYTSANQWNVYLDGTQVGYGGGTLTDIQAGDVFQVSDASEGTYIDGRVEWPFWLQGISLDPDYGPTGHKDGGYTYGQNPQALVTAYGPSGNVVANALKILWPCQCNAATEVDQSGVSNDGTYTGTSLGSADGASAITTPWSGVCGVTANVPAAQHYYRQMRG